MATVTTPAGDVLEGVTGHLLAYYRGEGYEITDEEPEVGEQFPVHFPPADEGPVVDAVKALGNSAGEAADATGALKQATDDLSAPGPLDLH